MATSVDFQIVSVSNRDKLKIKEAVTGAIGSTAGRWRVQFIGNPYDGVWEMRVSGPGTETSDYLDGALGQHSPEFIASVVKAVISK